MRPIDKQMKDELVEKYKKLLTAKDNSEYAGVDREPNFDELKKEAGYILNYSLAEEQGFICCYCMSEITDKEYRKEKDGSIFFVEKNNLRQLAMKIEHFKSQSEYPCLVTYYNNLLCACEGGCVPDEKNNPKNLFCDTHKSEKDFIYMPHPANPDNVEWDNFEQAFQLRYIEMEDRIRVSSKDKNIANELEEILNLNCQTLCSARAAAWKFVEDKIKKGESIQKLLNQYSNRKKEDGKFFPYCETIVYLLKKRFKNIK